MSKRTQIVEVVAQAATMVSHRERIMDAEPMYYMYVASRSPELYNKSRGGPPGGCVALAG